MPVPVQPGHQLLQRVGGADLLHSEQVPGHRPDRVPTSPTSARTPLAADRTDRPARTGSPDSKCQPEPPPRASRLPARHQRPTQRHRQPRAPAVRLERPRGQRRPGGVIYSQAGVVHANRTRCPRLVSLPGEVSAPGRRRAGRRGAVQIVRPADGLVACAQQRGTAGRVGRLTFAGPCRVWWSSLMTRRPWACPPKRWPGGRSAQPDG
jgi:hypothetical protein